MPQEFLCNTYGLALFLIARGVQPTSAKRLGVSTVFVFAPEANAHFDDFYRARRQLSLLQFEAEGAR
jgi:hypothetical protein